MRPQRSSITEFPRPNFQEGAAIMESTRHKPTRAGFRCGLTLLGLTCLLGTAEALAIGAISRSLARGYARDQRRPLSKQRLCLQSGSGTSILAQPRRISLVLHTGREALDKLARTTRGAQGSRPQQAFRRYRTGGQLLKVIRRLLSRARLALCSTFRIRH